MDDERSPLEVPIEDAATIAALANYGLHASDHVSFDESGKDIFISVLEEVNAYDDESNHSNIPSMHTSIAHNLAQPQDMSQCMSHIMPSMSLSDRSENAHHINVSSCVSSAPSVAVNVDGRPMTIYEEDCNSVRQKISLLLSSKIMTQLDFLKEIGCSTDSLSRFMKLKGTWCGTNNSVFWAAQKYLRNVDLAGLTSIPDTTFDNNDPTSSSQILTSSSQIISSTPLMKRKSLHSTSTTSAANDDSDSVFKKTRIQVKMERKSLKCVNEELRTNVMQIILPNEITQNVAVYDNCDEVRAKSIEFIDQCGLKTKEWLRFIGNVNTKSWNDFMSYHGEHAGASNKSYYHAYVFLEKVRISRNVLKSESRLAAEEVYGSLGRPFKHVQNIHEMKDKDNGILKYVFAIKLQGEDTLKVPTYDDCDEIRQKSSHFLSTFGIRISEWLRFLGNINSKSWRDFMSYRGPRAGASNKSYYNAYVFLEKVRIARFEEKSASRLAAEAEFGEAGRPLKHEP